MSLFQSSEIYQFAIRIEENGEKFYRNMAEKFRESEVKELFSFLADEEIKHKRIFESMISKIEKYEPLESYPGEYFEYLRAYADRIIFDEKLLETKINDISDLMSAIDFALDNEVASILYYQEIKNLVPKNQRVSINKIIEEERHHFIKLSDIKNNLNK